MWPGGELPVYSPGQQETGVRRGGRDSGLGGGRATLESCAFWLLGLGSWGGGAGAE